MRRPSSPGRSPNSRVPPLPFQSHTTLTKVLDDPRVGVRDNATATSQLLKIRGAMRTSQQITLFFIEYVEMLWESISTYSMKNRVTG